MSVQNVNLGPSGHVVIAGNLNSLTVSGIFQGQGTSAIDLSVGLNLTNFTVLGGSSNLGGVRSANIAVGKDIVGLNIQHGIFNSLITAGVLIDGSPQNSSSGGNIGPDGSDAIFDSQLLAGVQIKNLLINGDVKSDYVTNPKPNPTGYPTRIVAGEVLEDRAPGRDSQGGFPQGTFTSGGNIDNFQITGALIDSVLAASVAPYGGNGTLPFANATVFNFYNAPTPPRAHSGRPGIQHLRCSERIHHRRDCERQRTTTAIVLPLSFPNFSEVSYYNETEINTITP